MMKFSFLILIFTFIGCVDMSAEKKEELEEFNDDVSILPLIPDQQPKEPKENSDHSLNQEYIESQKYGTHLFQIKECDQLNLVCASLGNGNKSFRNSCIAKAYGAKIDSLHPCTTKEFIPGYCARTIEGYDRNFKSLDQIEKEGAKLLHFGLCRVKRNCSIESPVNIIKPRPICGEMRGYCDDFLCADPAYPPQKKTFHNHCEMLAENFSFVKNGECEEQSTSLSKLKSEYNSLYDSTKVFIKNGKSCRQNSDCQGLRLYKNVEDEGIICGQSGGELETFSNTDYNHKEIISLLGLLDHRKKQIIKQVYKNQLETTFCPEYLENFSEKIECQNSRCVVIDKVKPDKPAISENCQRWFNGCNSCRRIHDLENNEVKILCSSRYCEKDEYEEAYCLDE